MKIYKFIYDTDENTGCDLFTRFEDARDALYAMACKNGYDGACDVAQINLWWERAERCADTFYLEEQWVPIDLNEAGEIHKLLFDACKKGDSLGNCGPFLLQHAADLIKDFAPHTANDLRRKADAEAIALARAEGVCV